MAEFAIAAVVAMIVLFIAIQFAALGRDAVALGDLNYQLARWATNGNNNNVKQNGSYVNSPGCQDIVSLITDGTASPYQSLQGVADGFIGRIAKLGGVVCGAPPVGGLGVTMTCAPPGSSSLTAAYCGNTRPQGSEVRITLKMDTKYALFLAGTGYSFFGIPFPKQLSNTQIAYTQ